MSEQELDQNLQEFLEIRQPGIDYAEHTKDDFALQIGVDLDNYKKFPRVDDNVTYKKEGRDRRGEIGDPERRHAGLQRSVQGRSPLLRLLAGAARPHALDESRVLRAARRGVGRRGAAPARATTRCKSCRPSAWTNGILPHVSRIKEEWSAFDGVDEMPELGAGVVVFSPFKPDPRYAECDKERLVNLLPREPRVPAARHRVVGGRSRRAVLARRDVRHPVGPVERQGAAARCATSRVAG